MWRNYKVNKEKINFKLIVVFFVSIIPLWVWSHSLRCKPGAAALVPVEQGEPSECPVKADSVLLLRLKTLLSFSVISDISCGFLQTWKQTCWKALLHFLIKYVSNQYTCESLMLQYRKATKLTPTTFSNLILFKPISWILRAWLMIFKYSGLWQLQQESDILLLYLIN